MEMLGTGSAAAFNCLTMPTQFTMTPDGPRRRPARRCRNPRRQDVGNHPIGGEQVRGRMGPGRSDRNPRVETVSKELPDFVPEHPGAAEDEHANG